MTNFKKYFIKEMHVGWVWVSRVKNVGPTSTTNFRKIYTILKRLEVENFPTKFTHLPTTSLIYYYKY